MKRAPGAKQERVVIFGGACNSTLPLFSKRGDLFIWAEKTAFRVWGI